MSITIHFIILFFCWEQILPKALSFISIRIRELKPRVNSNGNVKLSFWFNIGCKRSNVYGIACDIPCPIACKNNTCHIQNGGCLGCEPGVYGRYCNLSCPPNCKDSICHGKNGTCFTCGPGWAGIYCITSNTVYHTCNQNIDTWILSVFLLLIAEYL